MSELLDKLLEDLGEYDKREFRVSYREYLTVRRGDELERRESASCIGEARLCDPVKGWYRYEDAEIKIRVEDEVAILDLSTETELGKVRVGHFNPAAKEIGFQKLKQFPERIAVFLFPFFARDTLRDSIAQIRDRFPEFPLVRALLERKSGLPSPVKLEHVNALGNGFMVIQGPPGTGKTYTGSRLVVGLLAAGKRVGIMGPSHKAIANFCLALEKAAKEAGLRFLGAKAYSRERDKLNAEFFVDILSKDLPRKAADYHVVGGTHLQFARMMDRQLDVLVCDEAGQLSLSNVVAASRAAKSILFLGDQQQLPHVAQARHPEGAGESILDYLLQGKRVVPEDCGVFLGETWRMNEEITELISGLSYEGRLRSHESAAERRLAISNDPHDPLGPCGVRYVPVLHEGNEQQSEEEALAIKDLLRRLEGKVPPKEVLIVTPYRAHENKIREVVGERYQIGTVDRFQGMEADVVIYSMATSDPEHMPRDVEFLLSVNRMNVALSRARKKAILVCSPRLFEAPPENLEKVRLTNALCRVKDFSDELARRHAFRYVVVDIETTGLNPHPGAIIEIGALKFEGPRCVGEFQKLLYTDVPIEPQALQAHGISSELLKAEGEPAEKVLQEFIDFVGTDALVAHNGVSFDFPFLALEFQRKGLKPRANALLDTMHLSRSFLRARDGSLKLQSLCDTYHIVNERAHRAISDARATAQLFGIILKHEAAPVADDLWALSFKMELSKILEIPPGMELLREALDEGKELFLEYESTGKPPRTRWIRPRYLCVVQGGVRSVKALCLEDNIEKHFRLDRMRKLIQVR